MVATKIKESLQSLQLVRTAFVVRRRTSKSIRSQIYEIVKLRLGPGRLRPFDYYAYELYDDQRYSFLEKKEFVSWKPYEVWDKLNSPEWKAVCDDKLISYGIFQGLRLPYPEVYAVYHPNGRTYGSIPCLHSPEEMAEFLRRGMHYPFFGKPVKDMQGGGASSVDAIDHDRDVLLLTGGKEMSVHNYVRTVPVAKCTGEKLHSKQPAGYLFQARIRQHPLIDRLSGGRVACLRLVVLLGHDGPYLFRAVWKLAVNNNITDHGISDMGNIACSINCATGQVERVLQRRGPEGTEDYALGSYGRPVESHPNTQERLTDVQLPYWERTVALCLHAAAAFPGVRFQCWDVAMGMDGPLLLEVNYNGTLSQTPGCRGFYEAGFLRIWENVVRG